MEMVVVVDSDITRAKAKLISTDVDDLTVPGVGGGCTDHCVSSWEVEEVQRECSIILYWDPVPYHDMIAGKWLNNIA